MIDHSILDFLFSQQTKYAKDVSSLSLTGNGPLVSSSKCLIDGDLLIDDYCNAKGYLRLKSPDAFGLSRNKIYVFEFKTGFKDRAKDCVNLCPLSPSGHCKTFVEIFAKERNKQKQALVEHISSKAKDFFVFLCTMPIEASDQKPVFLVYVAVSDAPSIDEFDMTAQSLAAPKDSFDISSIQSSLRERLLVRNKAPFFFDEVYCWTRQMFGEFIESGKIICP